MSMPQAHTPTAGFRSFFNPATGEWITYTAIAEDNGGQLVQFTWRSVPGGVITGHILTIGRDTCRVLGASFGGMVAQEFAVAHPERVERLALACTSAGGDGGSSYPLHKLSGLPPQERAAAQLKLADSRWDERWLEAHPADRALAEGLIAAGQDQQDPAAAAARTAQLEARAGHDVWDRLDRITCPALVGYGTYDQIAPVQNSTAIASRLRGAELRGYEGGHLFLFQDPAALPEYQAFLQTPPR